MSHWLYFANLLGEIIRGPTSDISATEDIKKLGEFVQAEPAQEFANA